MRIKYMDVQREVHLISLAVPYRDLCRRLASTLVVDSTYTWL